MRGLSKTVFLMVAGLFLFTGCAAVNKGLDKTSEGAKALGKPVGKAMNIPASVAEGAAEGVQAQDQDNPFNR